MTMEVVNCFYEEKKNAEYLERQIEECPVREKRFIKRGIEYLYSVSYTHLTLPTN